VPDDSEESEQPEATDDADELVAAGADEEAAELEETAEDVTAEASDEAAETDEPVEVEASAESDEEVSAETSDEAVESEEAEEPVEAEEPAASEDSEQPEATDDAEEKVTAEADEEAAEAEETAEDVAAEVSEEAEETEEAEESEESEQTIETEVISSGLWSSTDDSEGVEDAGETASTDYITPAMWVSSPNGAEKPREPEETGERDREEPAAVISAGLSEGTTAAGQDEDSEESSAEPEKAAFISHSNDMPGDGREDGADAAEVSDDSGSSAVIASGGWSPAGTAVETREPETAEEWETQESDQLEQSGTPDFISRGMGTPPGGPATTEEPRETQGSQKADFIGQDVGTPPKRSRSWSGGQSGSSAASRDRKWSSASRERSVAEPRTDHVEQQGGERRWLRRAGMAAAAVVLLTAGAVAASSELDATGLGGVQGAAVSALGDLGDAMVDFYEDVLVGVETSRASNGSDGGQGGASGSSGGSDGGPSGAEGPTPPAASAGSTEDDSAAASDGTATFFAISDSLGERMYRYRQEEELFRDGTIGCPDLMQTHERTSQLFLRFSLYFRSLSSAVDSVRADYQERSRDIEALDRSFRQTGCPTTSPDGSDSRPAASDSRAGGDSAATVDTASVIDPTTTADTGAAVDTELIRDTSVIRNSGAARDTGTSGG